MVLLAEKDWFYALPTPNFLPPSESALKEQKKAIRLAGTCRATNLGKKHMGYCHWIFVFATLYLAQLVLQKMDVLYEQNFAKNLWINCQSYARLSTHYDTLLLLSLQAEANSYAALRILQGVAIPRVYGLYNVWGILHVLALQLVGEPIQSRQLTPPLCQKMKAALGHIHKAGYVHGDISLCNFCEREDGMVFIVDLEKCRRSTNKSEMQRRL